MDVLGWILWLLGWIVSLAWSLAWLLLGGWVSTAAQILAVLGIIAVYRYGWRRAPIEVWTQLSGFARFALGWLRGGGYLRPTPEPRAASQTETIRIVRVKEPGDVNLSTALSLLVLTGLWVLAMALRPL